MFGVVVVGFVVVYPVVIVRLDDVGIVYFGCACVLRCTTAMITIMTIRIDVMTISLSIMSPYL